MQLYYTPPVPRSPVPHLKDNNMVNPRQIVDADNKRS